ncbi:hypothetical protein FS837_004582 [Tulasnella sp. UAMH 9824]|nr:hypothetical protein FS837_004582 [Tulasnella sp. UAMH 9824]
MKVVGLLSGGKDSCFNLVHCVQNGHEVVALASLRPPLGKEEIDSYMYQTVGQDAIEVVAAALDLPLVRRVIAGTAIEQGSEYGKRSTLDSITGDETEDMYELLLTVKEKHPEVEAVSVGAILSNYQRVRVEHVCRRLGLTPLAYLWQRDQAELLSEMISAGMDAVLIKVAGIGLTDRHLGKSLAQMQPTLQKLNSLYGAHICGEGGEYETLTLDCPLFKSRIVLVETESVIQDESNAGMVAYLRIKQARLEPKETTSSHIIVPSTLDDQHASIRDSVGENADRTVAEGHTPIASHPPVAEIRDYELAKHNLSLTHISHINVYISDMELFARVNSVYGTFFGTSPPTRACIAVDLPAGTRVVMDCMAHADNRPEDRQALHVQGISYWASANIGPYSQAVAVGGELFVSGQIGLIPAQMQLPSPTSLAMESALAFQHLDRITTLIKSNSGRDWSPVAQGVIIWTAGAEHFNGARAAWANYVEETQHHIPSLFVACKAIPKNGVIEVQMLQHIGLSFVKDQETGMFEDKHIVPEASIVREGNWIFSTLTTDNICIALFTVRDDIAGGSPLPQSLTELSKKSVSTRLFYTAKSASVDFVKPLLVDSPSSQVPCRALGTQDDEWDAALLIFAVLGEREVG